MDKYIILHDASRGRSKSLGRAERHSPDTIPDPLVEIAELSEGDRMDAARDPEVSSVAQVIPTMLLAPVASDAEAAVISEGASWGVDAVGAAHSAYMGDGVRVCMLDTGIDAAHPAFTGMTLTLRDFTTGVPPGEVAGSAGFRDEHGHGTHCAGTIFGRDVDGVRIGVARGISKACIGKVLDGSGRGDSSMLFQGLQWAIPERADVVTMSIAFDIPYLIDRLVMSGWPIHAATSHAQVAHRDNLRLFDHLLALMSARETFDGGIVIVAAAGNESDRTRNIRIPSELTGRGMISVGALERRASPYRVANFSNAMPDISAPGVGIISAKAGGGLAVMTGTSMAAAHVAGVAALCWERLRRQRPDGNAKASELLDELVSSANRENATLGTASPADCGAGLVSTPRRDVSKTVAFRREADWDDFEFLTRGSSRDDDKIRSETVETSPDAAAPTCHFLAEIDQEILLGKNATLTVTISREVLQAALDKASASGSSPVEAEKPLIVDVIPRRNLRASGDTRAELNVPEPQKPATRFFDLVPTALGPLEVTVFIRQGMVSLAQLDLKATAVQERSETAGRATAASQGALNIQSPPMNQLRIFDSEDNGNLRFVYELSLPDITLQWFESRQIRVSHATYVDSLYRRIENHYRTLRTMPAEQQRMAFTVELRAMGGQLCEELFPDQLREQLWMHRSKIDAIQVISTEPFVPWELVFLRDREAASTEPGMFLAELGLTRWVHRGWHPSKVSIRKGRAKYVAPEYEDPNHRLLEAPKEARFLQSRLGATPVTADFGSVLTVLEQGFHDEQGFDLLHFICHGLAEQNNIANAALQLSCPREGGGWQSSAMTSLIVEQNARLKSPGGRQPIVVLNACQTGREGWQLTGTGGFAQAFLKAGAGIFVGTLWSVIDKPARLFVEALYEALLSGKTLGEAAKEARKKTKQEEPSSWLAYAVYGNPYARLVKEPSDYA